MPRPTPLNSPSEIPRQYGRTFSEYVSGYMFEIFLYGINLLLFSAAAFILLFKAHGLTRWLLLIAAATMFIIATCNLSMSMYIMFGFMIRGIRAPYYAIKFRHLCYLVNNVIAETLLIHRCYVIWSGSVRIIVVPALFLLVSSSCGAVFMSGSVLSIRKRKFMYLWMTLALNISVTVVSASRLWWMARRVRKILGPSMAKKYYSAMTIVIESGAIYSLYILIDQALKTVNRDLFILDAGLSQVVVVTPTLIIVQVALRRQTRNVRDTILMSQGTVVLSTVHSS